MEIIRQGDVILKQVELPDGKKKEKSDKQITVALGEVTGHHHTLYGSLPIDLFIFNNRRFLKIQEQVSFRHQEHHEIKVPKGDYEIIIEREYDYFEKEMKRVVD